MDESKRDLEMKMKPLKKRKRCYPDPPFIPPKQDTHAADDEKLDQKTKQPLSSSPAGRIVECNIDGNRLLWFATIASKVASGALKFPGEDTPNKTRKFTVRISERHMFTREMPIKGNSKSKEKEVSQIARNPRKPKPKPNIQVLAALNRQASMPQELKDRIRQLGGHKISLVITKQLFDTDVNDHHGRLLIPQAQTQSQYLTEEEIRDLDRDQEMCVILIDPSLNNSTIYLKKWNMNSTVYAMKKGWNEVKRVDNLQTNDIIQLWAFRIQSRLCFALVKPPTAEALSLIPL